MTVKIYKSEYNIENNNGDIKKKGYKLAVNPNNKNKVYLSVTNDNSNITREYDNLDSFFNTIDSINNKEDIFKCMQKDLEDFKTLPIPLYKESSTQKKRQVKPKKKSFKIPKKKPSKKKKKSNNK